MRLLTSLICLAMVSLTISLDDGDADNGEGSHFLVEGGYRPADLAKLGKYVVSIRDKQGEKVLYGSGHFCGGTIIGDKAVLTAAHCILRPNGLLTIRPSKIVIVVGSTTRLDYGGSARTYEVDKVIKHRDYSMGNLQNDIAIIKIKENFEFNNFTQKILIADHEPIADEECTVVGFGRVFDHGPLANRIFYADLKIWSTALCRDGSPQFYSAGMLCAISKQMEGISSCKGDSGGPLFCAEKVCGIVSYGHGCGQKNAPGYYTKVYAYKDWVRRNEGSDLKSELKRKVFWNILIIFLFMTVI